MFSRLRPAINRIALRLGYVPAAQLTECKSNLALLHADAIELLRRYKEFRQASNEAVAALLYNQDNRAKIDAANRKQGAADAQVIRLEDHRQ